MNAGKSLLHFDALLEYASILDDCGWEIPRKDDFPGGARTERKEDSSLWQTDLMARVEMVVQLPFVLAQTVVCQSLRGLASIVAGILVFDEERIKFGLIDIISVLAQVILLLIVALLGIFNPKWAGDVLCNLCDPNDGDQIGGIDNDPTEYNIPIRHERDSEMIYDAKVRNNIASVFMGIIEFPVGLVDALLKSISYSLTGAIFLNDRKRDVVGSIALGALTTIPNICTNHDAPDTIQHKGFNCSFTVNP